MSEDLVQKNINMIGKSIKQLKIDIKNAEKEKNPLPNDRFVAVMGDFVNQAKETHEVLEGMSKKMSSLFQSVSKYYAFDPKKYTMEEFFGDIKTFLSQFKVSVWVFIIFV